MAFWIRTSTLALALISWGLLFAVVRSKLELPILLTASFIGLGLALIGSLVLLFVQPKNLWSWISLGWTLLPPVIFFWLIVVHVKIGL